MNKSTSDLLILLLALVSLAPTLSYAASSDETAYERVIRTGTLRCGYITWPPFFEKDLKTGEAKGINADYVSAIAKSLDLKLEWTSEVPIGQSVEELRSGKIDAICASEGPLMPSTTKFLSYSKAFAYFPFFFYAKDGDHRFDNNLNAANTKATRIALFDGDVSGAIVDSRFTKATRHPLPQTASPTQLYTDVAMGKADLMIDCDAGALPFQKANPKSIRKVKMEAPLAVIPNTFSVLRGPQGNDLLAMLNQAIENIQNRNEDSQIFAPYLKDNPDMIYPAAKPYDVKK